MSRHFWLFSVAVAFLAISNNAVSATFDFAAIANNDGEFGAETITFNDASGLSVTASGFNAVFSKKVYNAYLDASFIHSGRGAPGGDGGLGVCKRLTAGAQCKPSFDDSVNSFESLKLVFNQPVTIDGMVFRNGNHGEGFLGKFSVSADDDPVAIYGLTHNFNTPLTGTEFVLTNINSPAWLAFLMNKFGHRHDGDRYNRYWRDWFAHGGSYKFKDRYLHEFYLSSMTVTAVPVPAAVWLFGSGLLGLFTIARRSAR